MAADALEVALWVARAFEEVGIEYFLGGSLASSLQGEPRSTNDIDFVVSMKPEQVEPLARCLGSDFEVDVESLSGEVRRSGSWNIFFLPLAMKVDLFMKKQGAFDASEFARRSPLVLRGGDTLVVKTPEDTVLRKLLWFRAGGEVSTTQWRDIVQVLRLSGPRMQDDYLSTWAEQLGVSALLERARTDAARSG